MLKTMRTLLSCILALLLPSLALAADVTTDVDGYVDVPKDQPATLFTITGDNYSWAIQRVDHGLVMDASASVYDTMPLGGTDLSGTTDVQWDFWNWGDSDDDGEYVEHRLVVTDENGNQQVFPFYVSYMGDDGFSRVAIDSWLNGEPDTVKGAQQGVWYPNNTVCSFGPQFRNFREPITDKWYMFTPVDLSKDGTQVVELVAGSMWVIGRVAVAVRGDSVVVQYVYYNKEIKGGSEFFTFFPDYESVQTVEPSELEGYQFGQVYSIAEDLGGDTDVLLFVRNRASFNSSSPGVSRWWKNLDWRAALRSTMLTHIGLADEYDYSKP